MPCGEGSLPQSLRTTGDPPEAVAVAVAIYILTLAYALRRRFLTAEPQDDRWEHIPSHNYSHNSTITITM